MKKIYILLCLIACPFFLFPQIVNQDQPQNGEWDFKSEKIWEVEGVGDETFVMPAELRLTDNNMLVFRDFQKGKSYIFNSDGEYINSFANDGDKKGEVSRYLNCFTAQDGIVIGSPDKLHFFSEKGEFLNSYENNLFECFPLHFVNNNEFIYALENIKAKLNIVLNKKDILIGEENKFTEFSGKKDEKTEGPSFVVLGLTPQIKMCFDPIESKYYYGKSSDYKIFICDKDGDFLDSFELKREKIIFTEEEKQQHFKNPRMTDEQRESLIKSLPGELASFFKIQVNNNLIYVFVVKEFNRQSNRQQIDIFSPEGKYLYRGFINCPENIFFRNPENIVIKGNSLYMIQYKSDGQNSTLVKYKIDIPEY